MEIRCKIEILLVRDLIDENGNIIPATDIIESTLLEEYESIVVTNEQYDYLMSVHLDGELHSLDEMREDFVDIYKQLSSKRLAYIYKMYEEHNMSSRLRNYQQRIKAYVIPILSTKFQLMFKNDYDYVVDDDIVYKLYNDGSKSIKLCLNKKIESLTSDAGYIEERAFQQCQYLKEVNLPSVIDIGKDAFIGCHSLTDIHLSDKLETIGDGAFMGCHFLDYLELPPSLAEIGDMAFCDCTNLTHIINDYDGNLVAEKRLHPNVLKIGENAFLDTPLEHLSENPFEDFCEE